MAEDTSSVSAASPSPLCWDRWGTWETDNDIIANLHRTSSLSGFDRFTPSPAQNGRMKAILTDLQKQSYLPLCYGPLLSSGFLRFSPGDEAMAATPSSNAIQLGKAIGEEDWSLKLVLIHENRHQLQHQALWVSLLIQEGFAPNRPFPPISFSLRELVALDHPDRSKMLNALLHYKERMLLNSGSVHQAVWELDAHLVTYQAWIPISGSLSSGRNYLFLKYVRFALNEYIQSVKTQTALHPETVLSTEETAVFNQAQQLYQALAPIETSLQGPQSSALILDIHQYAGTLFQARTGEATYDGKPYSLAERQIMLSGLEDTLKSMLGEVYQFDAVREDLLRKLEVVTSQQNRQIWGAQYTFLGTPGLQVHYRNDLYHDLNDNVRYQGSFEALFKKDHEIRLGLDRGWYWPPMTEGFFLKLSPMIFGGVAIDSKQFILGGNLNLEAHYDFELNQRTVLSVFAGVGGEASTNFSGFNLSYQVSAGIDLVRF
jgi:hypothetical protein